MSEKFIGRLDIGGGDASRPVEQEILLLAWYSGEAHGELFHRKEGKFHFQPLLQE